MGWSPVMIICFCEGFICNANCLITSIQCLTIAGEFTDSRRTGNRLVFWRWFPALSSVVSSMLKTRISQIDHHSRCSGVRDFVATQSCLMTIWALMVLLVMRCLALMILVFQPWLVLYQCNNQGASYQLFFVVSRFLMMNRSWISSSTCWKVVMLVPWNYVAAVEDDGLWPTLSIPANVKRFCSNGGGKTIPLLAYFSQICCSIASWIS